MIAGTLVKILHILTGQDARVRVAEQWLSTALGCLRFTPLHSGGPGIQLPAVIEATPSPDS